jgi:hypothetical protein
MKVKLRHHYGWVDYDIPEAKSVGQAAYLAVRKSHHFLTDKNHTYEAGSYSSEWGGETTHWNSVLIYRGEGATEYSGPPALNTPYWFAVKYADINENFEDE